MVPCAAYLDDTPLSCVTVTHARRRTCDDEEALPRKTVTQVTRTAGACPARHVFFLTWRRFDVANDADALGVIVHARALSHRDG